MDSAYLYGIITPSVFFKLRDDFSYPEKNKFAEIEATYPSIGGEAANSAIMLSKLGVKTKLDGNYLSARHSARVLRTMRSFKVDVSRLKVKENFGTEEYVVTDGIRGPCSGITPLSQKGPGSGTIPKRPTYAGRITCRSTLSSRTNPG